MARKIKKKICHRSACFKWIALADPSARSGICSLTALIGQPARQLSRSLSYSGCIFEGTAATSMAYQASTVSILAGKKRRSYSFFWLIKIEERKEELALVSSTTPFCATFSAATSRPLFPPLCHPSNHHEEAQRSPQLAQLSQREARRGPRRSTETATGAEYRAIASRKPLACGDCRGHCSSRSRSRTRRRGLRRAAS